MWGAAEEHQVWHGRRRCGRVSGLDICCFSIVGICSQEKGVPLIEDVVMNNIIYLQKSYRVYYELKMFSSVLAIKLMSKLLQLTNKVKAFCQITSSWSSLVVRTSKDEHHSCFWMTKVDMIVFGADTLMIVFTGQHRGGLHQTMKMMMTSSLLRRLLIPFFDKNIYSNSKPCSGSPYKS